MEIFKRFRTHAIIDSVLSLILGIIFIVDPIGASNSVALIIGIFVLASGICDMVRYFSNSGYPSFIRGNLFVAIIKVILGIFIMTHTATVVTLFAYIFSIFIIVTSVNAIEGATQLKIANVSGWIINMILAVLVLCAGILMLFVPFEATETASIIIGAALILDAVTMIYTMIRLKKIGKDFYKAVNEVIVDGTSRDVE